jgi:hypothetical protein
MLSNFYVMKITKTQQPLKLENDQTYLESLEFLDSFKIYVWFLKQSNEALSP